MTKIQNDEKRTDLAVNHLLDACEQFEMVGDVRRRLEIMEEAKSVVDTMFDGIVEQNARLSLPEFVKLMDLAGKPVAPELREQLKGTAVQ